MAWVKFTSDYNYRKPGFTIAYRAGMTQNVTAECATLAIAAGKAVRLRKTSRDSEPVEEAVGWQSKAMEDDNGESTNGN